MRLSKKQKTAALFLLSAYTLLSLLLLTRYPLVHSDESWLSGLTRSMMASGSPGVTEPFFDLKPRYPHAIKILFHILQMPLILLLGYSVGSVRLLSLLAGMAALILFFRVCVKRASFGLSLLCTAVLAFHGSFIHASHMARQEILLLCGLMTLALLLSPSNGVILPRLGVRLGLTTGLCVGLHPNSFLLGLGGGVALLLMLAAEKPFRLRPLLCYITTTALVAAVFVGISFLLDNQFPAHYRLYGETEFTLNVSLGEKFAGFLPYLQKLWLGESGTYLLPSLKLPLCLSGALTVWGTVVALRTKAPALLAPLGLTVGTLLGTVLIGRYNQLSAMLWILPPLLLLAPLLQPLRLRSPAAALLALALTLTVVGDIRAALPYDYAAYLAQVSACVQPETKTLANLNTGFYFQNGALLDIRNLSYLKENHLTFADYVNTRGIRVILWPDEMAFLFARRPSFNALYGNPRYVPEVETYLRDHCTLLGTFENPGYATRIIGELGKPYRVRAYRVNP